MLPLLREFRLKILTCTSLYRNINKTLWVLDLPQIVPFLGKFRSSPRVPSYLYYKDTTLFQSLDFSIHDFNRFLHKMVFRNDLDFIKRNCKCVN